MYYQSIDPGYGNGSLDLARLTAINTLACGSAAIEQEPLQPEAEFSVTPVISGAWYDPGHSGEGWLLEILANGQAAMAGFTHDLQGRQAWFYGVVRFWETPLYLNC